MSSPNARLRVPTPPQAVVRVRECEMCPKSKAISIIFVLMFMTGMISGMISYSATNVINRNLNKNEASAGKSSSLLIFGSHSIAVLGLLLYPLSGFLADVCCGRYLMIIGSTSIMSLGMLFFSISLPFYESEWEEMKYKPYIKLLYAVAYLLSTLGVAGFRANVVQFGLDQLMDHNSRYLSLYLHWLVWIQSMGSMISVLPLTLAECDYIVEDGSIHLDGIFQFLPLATFLFLAIALIIAIKMKKSFYTELGNINPYKMVLKVIGYALRNRYPQQRRSAFYYYSSHRPGRLDFAKVHYGGPFPTEDVENVKTFLQILIVLICVGPVFIVRISTTYFMYKRFVFHVVRKSIMTENCLVFWPLLGSGNQVSMMSVLFFPIYITIIFKVLKGIPKILTRLLVVLVMWTVCIMSMLSIELVGHYNVVVNGENGTETACALVGNYTSLGNNSLGMHWSYLLVPSTLLGLALPILYTTVFEFISAQSPRSMTGLLMGTFFCVEGIFQLIGAVNLIPFSLTHLWNKGGNFTLSTNEEDTFGSDIVMLEDGNHPNKKFPFSTVCEIWYYVDIIVIGSIGIVLFSIAAWRYKYRKREEDPFPQSDIEEIITRDIDERDPQNMMDVTSVEVHEERGRLLYNNNA